MAGDEQAAAGSLLGLRLTVRITQQPYGSPHIYSGDALERLSSLAVEPPPFRKDCASTQAAEYEFAHTKERSVTGRVVASLAGIRACRDQARHCASRWMVGNPACARIQAWVGGGIDRAFTNSCFSLVTDLQCSDGIPANALKLVIAGFYIANKSPSIAQDAISFELLYRNLKPVAYSIQKSKSKNQNGLCRIEPKEKDLLTKC